MIGRRMLTAATLAALAGCADAAPTEPAIAGADAGGVPLAAVLAPVSFSGTDVPVALIDPGSLEVTQTQYLMRGVALRFRLDTTDPRMTGFGTVVANGNLSIQDGSGPVWGELEIDSDQGDHWSGSWHGKRTMASSVWLGELDYVLRGTGAAGGRLMVHGQEIITTFSLVPNVYFGQIEGTIVNLGGIP